MTKLPEKLPYRPCVGLMVANDAGQIFVGQRIDTKVEAWQMPQGGIDPGEEPLEAALRELWEETGIVADLVEEIARSREEYYYDLPDNLVGKVWGANMAGSGKFGSCCAF